MNRDVLSGERSHELVGGFRAHRRNGDAPE
jgi:hypothetical protein